MRYVCQKTPEVADFLATKLNDQIENRTNMLF